MLSAASSHPPQLWQASKKHAARASNKPAAALRASTVDEDADGPAGPLTPVAPTSAARRGLFTPSDQLERRAADAEQQAAASVMARVHAEREAAEAERRATAAQRALDAERAAAARWEARAAAAELRAAEAEAKVDLPGHGELRLQPATTARPLAVSRAASIAAEATAAAALAESRGRRRRQSC